MNWLFLRGLGREQRHWGQFGPLYENQVPGHKVHYLDLPGFGEENHCVAPPSIKQNTEFLRHNWRRLLTKNNDGPWTLLGLSLGGMIALDWAHRYPKDFKGVAIINASDQKHAPLWKRMRVRGLQQMLRILTAKEDHDREREALFMTSNKFRGNKDIIDEWVNYHRDRPRNKSNVFLQLLAATKFSAPKPIETPLLFLISQEDQMVHPECSANLARYYNAKTEFHPGAGHDLPLDAPEWTIEHLREFVDDLS